VGDVWVTEIELHGRTNALLEGMGGPLWRFDARLSLLYVPNCPDAFLPC
jgi:hypothetical protein